jgi:prolyl oligopeptidase
MMKNIIKNKSSHKNSLLMAMVLVSSLAACTEKNSTIITPQQNVKTVKMIYPVTKQGNVIDTYFGNQVKDPYRWLEDDRSKETSQWVIEQNKVTFDYLENIPYRDTLKQRLTALWNFEKVSVPFTEGAYNVKF